MDGLIYFLGFLALLSIPLLLGAAWVNGDLPYQKRKTEQSR
jgi:hypothetical protein